MKTQKVENRKNLFLFLKERKNKERETKEAKEKEKKEKSSWKVKKKNEEKGHRKKVVIR